MDTLIEHYTLWSRDKTQRLENEAKQLQNKMAAELPPQTPVQKYNSRSGVVNHITVNRVGNNPAVRVTAPDYEQPGAMRQGWQKATVKLGKNGQKVYAVRNKALPTIVHLINFDRDFFSHGQIKKRLSGSFFVTNIQDTAAEELKEKIRQIMESE